MPQTNFPTIHLTINGEDFSDTPPEYIQELIFEDLQEGAYSVEVLLHDKEFTRIEDAILRAPQSGNLSEIVASFGYTIDGKLYSSERLRVCPSYYLPTFGAGVDARLRGYAFGAQFNVEFSEPLNFDNVPYHEVVKTCAQKILGADTQTDWIQETREGQNYTGSVEPFGKVINFLNEDIVPSAEDKQGNTGFKVGFIKKGDVLSFGTPEFLFEKRLEEKQEIPTFTWLAGKADSDVIEFRPDFSATSLGNFAAHGLKCVGWDAIQKRQVTIAVNPTSAALEKKTGKYLAKGAAAVSLGKDATNQSIQGIGTELRERIFGANSYVINPNTWLYDLLYGEAKTNDVSGPESIPYAARLSLTRNTLEELQREAFCRWRQLFNVLRTATLTLNGSERTVDLRANDLVRVLILIPKTNQVHWSSGVWWINKIRHEMTSDYTVTCELKRNANATGIQQIPGGVTFVDLEGF